MKPHAIVTCCDAGYGEFLVHHWLRSLQAHVRLDAIDVIVLDYGLTDEHRSTLRERGVIVRSCVRDGNLTNIRHRDLTALLTESRYDQVLSIDGGDIIFQADISPLFEQDTTQFRGGPEPRFTGAMHVYNFGATDLRPDVRRDVVRFLHHRPIINGGVVYGPSARFVELFAEMRRLCHGFTRFATDQLLLSNYLYQHGFVPLDQRYNFVLVTTRRPFRVVRGVFLDEQGEPIPVVHNAGGRESRRIAAEFGYGPDRNRIKWNLRATLHAGQWCLRQWKSLVGPGVPDDWLAPLDARLPPKQRARMAHGARGERVVLAGRAAAARVSSRRRARYLRTAYARHPLLWRPGSSDLAMFMQMFALREYSCLDDLTCAGLILDCGANVGYASAYFLTRFPDARVIAVEPDPANFAILEQNLAPFAPRVQLRRAGVWSHECGLVIDQNPGWFQECARQVREAAPGEATDLHAVGIGTLLAESGAERISILKIDIERSEREVFARHYESWLGRVDCLLVELHDAECHRVFHEAIAGQPFDVMEWGELTVCRRRSASPRVDPGGN